MAMAALEPIRGVNNLQRTFAAVVAP